MRSVVIYFSMTGNTEKVAKAIQGGIESATGQCDISKLKEAEPTNLLKYDLIGLGAPSYFYREPLNVAAYINRMKPLAGKDCFIFSTSGGRPGNILPNMARRLERVGLRVIGSFDCDAQFFLPIRFVPWYTDGHPDDIDLKAAADFGTEMVDKSERLAKGQQVPLPNFKWLRYGPYQQVARDFKGTGQTDLVFDQEKCKYPECRLCVDNCPVDAIDLSVDPPVLFAKSCIRCYFCELICPAGAINYAIGVEAFFEWEAAFFNKHRVAAWFKKAETDLIDNRGSLYRRLGGEVDLDNRDNAYYKLYPTRPWFTKI